MRQCTPTCRVKPGIGRLFLTMCLLGVLLAAVLAANVKPLRADLMSSPVADALLRKDKPNANFGSSTQLVVDATPRIDTLLRFEASGIGAAGVKQATIRLYVVDGSNAGGSLFSVSEAPWTERGVTWNKAPPAASTVPLATTGSVVRNTWVSFDVTSRVTRDGIYSFRMSSPSTDSAGYVSREGALSLRPQLVVVLSPPDSTPPSIPTGVMPTAASAHRVNLTWDSATDDTGIAGYDIVRDGSFIGDSTTTSYTDWTVAALSAYQYQVVARDVAGQVSASSDPVGITTPDVAPTTLKHQLGGVADRWTTPDETHRQVVNTRVVAVPWAQLQPTRGATIASGNPIDTALSQVRDLNTATPGLNFRIRLRVLAGSSAPDWAKNLDGPPMRICDPSSGACSSVPRFWTDQFRDAYQDLQDQLSARYDAMPELMDTAVTRCTTLFGEPFIRQSALSGNRNEYARTGYTLALDARCQHAQIDAHRAWETTRSSLALNPYQSLDTSVAPPAPRNDEAFTETMMGYCRSSLGPACVLGNNSLRDTSLGADYDQMYTTITQLGAPIYYQTATLNKLTSLSAVLTWAADHGAGLVELPSGYETAVDLPDLALLDARLEASAG